MKKTALLLLVFITLVSCKNEVPLTFSEMNFTSAEEAIIEINIPKFDGNTEVSNKINAWINNFIASVLSLESDEVSDFSIQASTKRFNAEYKESKETFPENPHIWEAFIDGEVIHKSSEVVSVAVNSYTNTGGTKGNSFIYFMNFNPVNGALYKKDDIVNNMDGFKILVEESFKKSIDATSEELAYFFEKGFKLPDSFGFNEDGVIIFYNHFELGIYDGKMIEFTIPYEELSDHLKVR